MSEKEKKIYLLHLGGSDYRITYEEQKSKINTSFRERECFKSGGRERERKYANVYASVISLPTHMRRYKYTTSRMYTLATHLRKVRRL